MLYTNLGTASLFRKLPFIEDTTSTIFHMHDTDLDASRLFRKSSKLATRRRSTFTVVRLYWTPTPIWGVLKQDELTLPFLHWLHPHSEGEGALSGKS